MGNQFFWLSTKLTGSPVTPLISSTCNTISARSCCSNISVASSGSEICPSLLQLLCQRVQVRLHDGGIYRPLILPQGVLVIAIRDVRDLAGGQAADGDLLINGRDIQPPLTRDALILEALGGLGDPRPRNRSWCACLPYCSSLFDPIQIDEVGRRKPARYLHFCQRAALIRDGGQVIEPAVAR